MNFSKIRADKKYKTSLTWKDKLYLKTYDNKLLYKNQSTVVEEFIKTNNHVNFPFVLRIKQVRGLKYVSFQKKWVYIHPKDRYKKSMKYLKYLKVKTQKPDLNYIKFFNTIFKV